MEQTRAELKSAFSNGKRPSGEDFANLLESFINPKDDSIRKDAAGNFVITLGNVPTGAPGTLRFAASKVQFFDGAVWQDVGTGSGSGFQPVAASQNIAYSNGNVGIGTQAVPPSARLEVALNTGEQAKIGKLSVGNSAAPFTGFAQLSHIDRANGADFALRQGPNGNVNLNAAANQKLILSQNGSSPRLSVTESGFVVVGADSDIGNGARFQVNGSAFKGDGSPNWLIASDARLKKDVRPFEDGLDKLLQINPVHFKYNGLAQTPDNHDQVGILGQEMAQILPYTVSTATAQLQPNEAPINDMLTFDPNALVYVLINAVKELAGKVQSLEKELSER